MSIKYKLSLFFVVQHLLFFIIAYSVVVFFVRPYNLKTEEKIVKEKVVQIRHIFKNELEHLANINKDWSEWDDSYKFMQNKNKEYMKSNLHVEILENLKINVIEYFDVSGSSYYKATDGSIDVGDVLNTTPNLKQNILDFKKDDKHKAVSGIVAFKSNMAFISFYPIIYSDGTGKPNGILMFVEVIDSKTLKLINKSTNAKVFLFGKNALISHAKDKNFFIRDISATELKAGSVLKNLDGRKAVVFEAVLDRDLIVENEKLIQYFFIFASIVAIISFITSLFLLKQEITKPINSLISHILKIKKDDEYTQINMKIKDDEIGVLAKEFNILLKEVKAKNHTLSIVARIDPLTGLANRMNLEERFEQEKLESIREGTQLSVLMLDIDCFKKYNDTYGHVKGDNVLVEVAQAIKFSCMRPYDLTARYGGEEFIVFLPRSSEKEAVLIAKRILENIEDLNIEHKSSLLDNKIISISIGCISMKIKKGDEQGEIVALADKALYIAKENGRNQYHYLDTK